MILSLTANDYRILKDVTVTFEPFTVLVGPNASGKSTVLAALQEMADGAAQRGAWDWSSIDGAQLAIEFAERGHRVPLLRLESRGARCAWSTPGDRPIQARRPDRFDLVDIPRVARNLKLIPGALRNPSAINTPVHSIDFEGQGLASLLADLKLADDPRFQRIADALRAIVPSVQQFQVGRDPSTQTYFLTFDTTTRKGMRAEEMSDGTLFTLGLLAALASTEGGPALVLIDDIDQGLHPRAQAELVKQLRAVQATRPDLQIVATSHSPYLIDCFDPTEVRILTLDDKGRTRVARMVDHPEFEKWKDVMAPGEFWSSIGESWVPGAAK